MRVILPFLVTALTLSVFSQAYSQAQSPEDRFKQAEIYFFQNKGMTAKQLLLEVIKENPAHPKAYSYLGDIALMEGKYREALNYYSTARELSAEPAKEYFRMGQTYIKLGEGSRAIDSFQRSYSLDPSMKISLYQIGYVYLVLMRDKHKTIEFWKKFLAESPNDPQYAKVEEAIRLLMDEKCVLPPVNSDITLEETLKHGCRMVEMNNVKTEDGEAGHAGKKTNNNTAGIPDEDDL